MGVFALNDRGSLLALATFYDQICRALGCTDPPILIVGNKSDLPLDPEPIRKEAQKMIATWPNAQYLETSAKLNVNINEAFSRLVKMIRNRALVEDASKENKRKPRRKRRCIIQ